jgi:hypothetical protein
MKMTFHLINKTNKQKKGGVLIIYKKISKFIQKKIEA